MRKKLLAGFVTASTLVFALAGAAQAQSASQTTDNTRPAKKQKPAAKTAPKVWTEDNISTVRTQADKVIDASDRQQQAANDAAAAAQDAAQKQPSGDPAKPVKKAPLSQAKSAEDAQAKIEWEKRDIRGQEEYIASLEGRLSSATPQERAHLQQLIVLHKQYIVDTQKEMQGLEEQKRNFQKKPSAPAAAPEPPAPVASAEAQPPSQ